MQKQSMSNPSIPLRFQSLHELIRHFKTRLSVTEIENTIRETGQLFICRGAKTDEQERFTFIQRCHEALEGSLLIHEDELFEPGPRTRA